MHAHVFARVITRARAMGSSGCDDQPRRAVVFMLEAVGVENLLISKRTPLVHVAEWPKRWSAETAFEAKRWGFNSANL